MRTTPAVADRAPATEKDWVISVSSKYSAGDSGPGFPSPEPVLSIWSCSGFGYPSGRRSAAFTTENIAVFAPIPSAIVSTAMVVNPGLLRRVREA